MNDFKFEEIKNIIEFAPKDNLTQLTNTVGNLAKKQDQVDREKLTALLIYFDINYRW